MTDFALRRKRARAAAGISPRGPGPGMVQAEDGTWVPASFYGGAGAGAGAGADGVLDMIANADPRTVAEWNDAIARNRDMMEANTDTLEKGFDLAGGRRTIEHARAGNLTEDDARIYREAIEKGIINVDMPGRVADGVSSGVASGVDPIQAAIRDLSRSTDSMAGATYADARAGQRAASAVAAADQPAGRPRFEPAGGSERIHLDLTGVVDRLDTLIGEVRGGADRELVLQIDGREFARAVEDTRGRFVVSREVH